MEPPGYSHPYSQNQIISHPGMVFQEIPFVKLYLFFQTKYFWQ